MKLEKLLLVKGEAASHNYPQLNLTISVFDNAESWMVVTLGESVTPLNTAAIAEKLEVKETDVCRFLHCTPGTQVVKCLEDDDGNLAKIRWLCLTGFAGAVHQHDKSA
ncbi:hypothetical protein [Candidatus Allofournierella merdipullorum]|uniref:hypothetical protein n=1 Tax=Candidatus Allofournierella merdipullorum TaxID=2838595 RepID=UPI00374EE998